MHLNNSYRKTSSVFQLTQKHQSNSLYKIRVYIGIYTNLWVQFINWIFAAPKKNKNNNTLSLGILTGRSFRHWLIRVYMDILPLQVLNTHSIILEACPQSMSMFQQKTTAGHLHKKRLEIIVILNTHESFRKCIQHSHYKCLEQ